MKGKKSLAYTETGGLILALAIIIVLVFNTEAIADVLKKKSDIELCRLSVVKQATLKAVGTSLTKLDCERRKVEFFENKVEINGKEEPKYEFKDDKLEQKTVNQVVAEELRWCWYMMGEGELNVFEQKPVDISPTPTAERVCAICSEISFDKKVTQNQFSGLIDYLKVTKIPKQDVTYLDYLIRSQRDKYFLWGFIPWTQYTPWGWGTTDRISDNIEESAKEYEKSKSDNSFRHDQRYIVYFLASKPPWLKEKFGHTTSAYYIGLATPSKVTEECTRLVN